MYSELLSAVVLCCPVPSVLPHLQHHCFLSRIHVVVELLFTLLNFLSCSVTKALLQMLTLRFNGYSLEWHCLLSLVGKHVETGSMTHVCQTDIFHTSNNETGRFSITVLWF